MKKNSEYYFFRIVLMCICAFIGLGAVYGATMMLIDPTGKLLQMDTMLPYFKVLPFADVLFKNYIFSGISLLIVNGITNIIAFYFLLKDKKIGIYLGMIFGITLMLWIIIQFVIFPANFLSITYFIFGLIQFIVGYTLLVSFFQKEFVINEESYNNIGKDDKKLVVYFSRKGYVKKCAYEEAEKTGANIYEIKPKEKIEGLGGFWWCGRFGMHKWEMPIEDISLDLLKYEHITIYSPIWVFNVSAPVRSFCKMAKNKIKNVDYVLVHFTKIKYNNAVSEMNSLLNVKATTAKNICTRLGKIKSINKEICK